MSGYIPGGLQLRFMRMLRRLSRSGLGAWRLNSYPLRLKRRPRGNSRLICRSKSRFKGMRRPTLGGWWEIERLKRGDFSDFEAE